MPVIRSKIAMRVGEGWGTETAVVAQTMKRRLNLSRSAWQVQHGRVMSQTQHLSQMSGRMFSVATGLDGAACLGTRGVASGSRRMFQALFTWLMFSIDAATRLLVTFVAPDKIDRVVVHGAHGG